MFEESLVVPTQFVLSDKTVLVGFETGMDPNTGFIQLEAATEVSGAQDKPLFNPVLDAFTRIEVSVADVRYCQPLLPEMGARAQAYGQFLAFRELMAKERNVRDYSSGELYGDMCSYISAVEKAQASDLPITLREAAYYSYLVGSGRKAEAEQYLEKARADTAEGSVDKSVDKACTGTVVQLDFRARNIGKTETLDNGGGS